MSNKEKFAKEIIEIAINGENISVVGGKPRVCGRISCDGCDFYVGNCIKKLEKWANSEYKEIEIDWDRVPVDTPVLVWDMFAENKRRRYYAGLKNGRYMAFDGGATNWSSNENTTSWSNCELAREKDIQKYRKR